MSFVCKNCGKVFPQLKRCVCPACGKTQHELPEYFICPICGKKSDYYPFCHTTAFAIKPQRECTCARCSQTFHEFRNHRCAHCLEWEVHEHEELGYNLIYKENKLYYQYRCYVCHEQFVQENKPKPRITTSGKLQPFVFRNGSKAFSVQELVELCFKYPEDGCYHLLEGHFESWLKYLAEADRVSMVNVENYKIASMCSELRSPNTEYSPEQELHIFITKSCELLHRFESDGQNWVLGWD